MTNLEKMYLEMEEISEVENSDDVEWLVRKAEKLGINSDKYSK